MRLQSILSGLLLGLAPVPSLAAATAAPAAAPAKPAAAAPAAAKPGDATPPAKAGSAGPSDVLVVLKSAPAAAPGCKVVKDAKTGALQASLFSLAAAACPVAIVAGEQVYLEELADALAESHMGEGAKGMARKAKGQAMDFKPVLDRIIDVRLIALEGREMGIQEDPDYKKALQRFGETALRTDLQKELVADVKADSQAEEGYFKATVKEYKLRSVKFFKEDEAKGFREAVLQGGSFEALARAAVAAKKAESGEPGYVAPAKLVPELAKAAEPLKENELTPPVKLANGFVIMRLEGFRYPEDAKARDEAHERALAEAQRRAIRTFHAEATRKYATVDEALLKSIDFEAKGEAGVAELLKDQRALAQIQGEAPITVAELTRDCIEKFFHGVAEPIKEHRINPGKQENWEKLLGSRLFLKEARMRKLDQAPLFVRRLAGYDRILSFNSVLERAIIPGVSVTEREAMALYEKRKKSFSAPAMFRLEGIGFTTTAAAQAALAKVKAGTDLAFMKNNAEGRLKPEAQQLTFDGALLSTNTLPASLTKALAGAGPGDLRLYDAEGGAQHYLVKVTEYQPPGVRPYEDMREKMARELEAQKIAAAIKDYAAKLRKVQKVDVNITRIAG